MVGGGGVFFYGEIFLGRGEDEQIFGWWDGGLSPIPPSGKKPVYILSICIYIGKALYI